MVSQLKSPPFSPSTEPPWLSEVVIRLVREEDLSALEWDGEYSHFRNVFLQAWQRFQKGLSVLWVAELPDIGIIGQVFIQLICDRHELADGKTRAYLYSFRVRPAYRGRGLGSRILQTVEDDLRRRGFRYVTLNVGKENRLAQKMYKRHGYQIVAHEPGNWSYIDDKGILVEMHEPAWRMEKTL